MMLPTLRQVLRPTAAAALCLTLSLGLGACGGDDEPDGSGGGETAAPAGDVADAGEVAPVDSPAGGVTYVDSTEPAADTIVVDEGGFTADTSTIEVGDVVLFITGDEGIYGVVVGDLDGYTVTTGLNGAFRFDAPGTYAVREEISDNTATITVEE
ncbi:hypothetical protein NPS01_12120 [Nocardioides psychrotolerans]|nr:CHAP domain-containing protein [Nocardioides psychrotolerans]GEP37549.1 hypothetical protein NPS01_12120 [Nocardioides psychrotolerans]